MKMEENKMSKKFLAIALGITMAIGLVTGCTSETSNEVSTSSGTVSDEVVTKEDVVKIAFVISDLTNETFVELMTACKQEAEKVGAEFVFQEAQEIEQKITSIENLTNAGHDVIISHVSDPQAMQPSIDYAQEAGVKFIAYDTDTDTSDAFFGADNYELGRRIGIMAANWINETYDANETVKVGITNYPTFNFLIIRENGILDALAEFAPNTEIVVSQQAGFITEGVDVGEIWLQSQSDLDVICGINDSGVVGVYQSFIAGGMDPYNENMGMFACDATGEALNLIADNGIYRGTITTSLIKTAPNFIETAIKLAKGEEVEHDYFFPMNEIRYDEETGAVVTYE